MRYCTRATVGAICRSTRACFTGPLPPERPSIQEAWQGLRFDAWTSGYHSLRQTPSLDTTGGSWASRSIPLRLFKVSARTYH